MIISLMANFDPDTSIPSLPAFKNVHRSIVPVTKSPSNASDCVSSNLVSVIVKLERIMFKPSSQRLLEKIVLEMATPLS